jgi:hypothetical protein
MENMSERPPIPVRPASPLPPGVPTGPRNQNKYKDRDGNAPAVDGLDYGGGNKDGARTEAELDDRAQRWGGFTTFFVCATLSSFAGNEGVRLVLWTMGEGLNDVERLKREPYLNPLPNCACSGHVLVPNLAPLLMAVLSAIPSEIVLLICAALDDEDLRNLCQVSKRFNPLALDTYLARRAISNSDIVAGNISVTSHSMRGIGLALFISSVKSLHCVFDPTTAWSDIRTLTRFVSGLPQISQVEISTRFARHLCTESAGRVVDLNHLIDGLCKDKSSSLLVLDADGCLCGSTCARRHGRIEPLIIGGFDDRDLVDSRRSVGPVSWGTFSARLTPPDSHMRQNSRSRKHLLLSPHSLHSIQFSYPAIPDPYFSNCAMIRFNSSTLTSLSIGCTTARCHEWHRILPTIFLPALAQLSVQYGAKLRSSDLRTFVHRHPTITTLGLHHFSVQYSDLMPFTNDSLPNLDHLSAPAQHITTILRSLGNCRQLYGLEIGLCTPTSRFSFGSSVDFDELNEIFTVVRNHNVPRFIAIWFPAGIASKDWFMKVHRVPAAKARVELGMDHVISMAIRTEGDRPFHPDVLPLLPNWLALFPCLVEVSIRRGSVGGTKACNILARSIYSQCRAKQRVLSNHDARFNVYYPI